MSARVLNHGRADLRLLPSMATGRKSQTEHFEYLVEETLRLINVTVRDLSAVSGLRLVKLLSSNRVHFGPDPVNPTFRKFLRTSLKVLNYKAASLLLEKYIELSELRLFKPDYLFLLFDYAKDSEDKFDADPVLFLELAKLLSNCSDINAYSTSHRMSTLELIVSTMDSDIVRMPSPLGLAARLSFDYLITLSALDPNLSQSRLENPKTRIPEPLQVALEQSKFEAAAALLRRGAAVKNLNLSNVLFCRTAASAFQLLYQAGHKFPSARVLRHEWYLFEGDVHFEQFIKWLEKRQRGVLPLSCICWTVLRSVLGADAVTLYKELSEQFLLPKEFENYVLMRSFELTCGRNCS